MKHTPKIILTGGHITPALAMMDTIIAHHPTWHLVCIGRVDAIEGNPATSQEKRLVEQKGVKFLPLVTGRFTRIVSVSVVWSLLKVPWGVVQSFWYLVSERPDLVLSFGGYISFPVVLCAWILRIPVVMHEQSLRPGLTTKLLAPLAKRICLTFPGSQQYFKRQQVVVTGLPVRPALFTLQRLPSTIDDALPVLCIMGGTTGARSMNDLLFPLIPSLVSSHTIVHQTGALSYEKAQDVRNALPESFRSRYIIERYIDEPTMAWLFHHAELFICRAGANTVVELALFGKPAVFFPLPNSDREQDINAAFFTKHEAGEMVHQYTATVQRVDTILKQVIGNQASYTAGAQRVSKLITRDGADHVRVEVEALLRS